MSERRPIEADALGRALEGRYTDLRLVRRGGQGQVWRARRIQTKDRMVAADDVALKLFFDRRDVERVEREVNTLAAIRHPTLAELIEHGTVTVERDVVRFVAYQFIEGTALDQRIRANGPLPPATVAAIGRDIATAIGEIWNRSIVHRDVNPKNIMLRLGDREAVLIDLGIAKHLAQSSLTSGGWVWGTPGYMSPEQARGDALTAFSDVYTLGLSLVEALIGRHPTNGDQQGLPDALGDPSTVVTLLASTPAGLVQLLGRMLAPRTSFRPNPALVAERFALLARTL